MTYEIVRNIKVVCKKAKVPMPNIFTEFGSFTVGEVYIYSVAGEKVQNDQTWYMIDSHLLPLCPIPGVLVKNSLCYRLINGMSIISGWCWVALPATAMITMTPRNTLMKSFYQN